MGASVPTILMNFSGIYPAEGFLPEGAEVLDFTSLEGGCCYCDSEAASVIRDAIGPYSARGVHWLDSGDYHYASLFWLEKVARPFCLVLFDNHPDDQPTAFGSPLLSCGSWVLEARKLPMLQAVLHIRRADDVRGLPASLPVYLSIDKDVLNRDSARTDWEQGTMTLEELRGALAAVTEGRCIAGADVCGELTPGKGAVDTDLITNRRTNDILQGILLNLMD